jgi:hypothetical protein
MSQRLVLPVSKWTIAVLLMAGLLAAGLWAVGIGPSRAASVDIPAKPAGVALADTTPVAVGDLGPSVSKDIETLRSIQHSTAGELHDAGDGVWINTDPGRTCLFVTNVDGVGSSCQSDDKVTSRGMMFLARSTTSDASQIVGLVPDGVTSVSAQSEAGSTVAEGAVQNNIYRVSGRGISTLRFNGGSVPSISVAG